MVGWLGGDSSIGTFGARVVTALAATMDESVHPPA